MSRDSTGKYSLVPVINPVIPDTIIETGWANPTLNDMANALTQSIASNGVTPILANLPMSSFRHTGVAGALAFDQYTRADQVQTNSLTVCVSVGGPVAYTGTLPLGTLAFSAGQNVFLSVPLTNTGAVTLQINGGAVYPVLSPSGGALVGSELVPGGFTMISWDGAAWRLTSTSYTTTFLDNRYVQRTGATMTGTLVLAGDPVAANDAATAQWVIDQIVNSVSGVATWNGRVGAVTLTSADVTAALTFTPYDATNPAGYISGITGGMVNAALGYTAANAGGQTFTGAITAPGVTSSTVVTAKGFTQTISSVNVTGAFNADYTVAQSQILNLTGAATISPINTPRGSIIRIVILNTNLGVTWAANVHWPNAIAPDLTTGPLKYAVVVLEEVSGGGGNYLATAAAY